MLTAVAVLLPLLLWSRARVPAAVRVATRASMVVFAQGTAIALVFTGVNREMDFCTSWGDLFGTDGYVTAAPDLGPDGLGGKKAGQVMAEPKVHQAF